MNDELVTIRHFGDMSEALLAKGCLDAAGVECFLTDVNVTRLEWPLSRGMKLQVKPADAGIAIEVLTPQPYLLDDDPTGL